MKTRLHSGGPQVKATCPPSGNTRRAMHGALGIPEVHDAEAAGNGIEGGILEGLVLGRGRLKGEVRQAQLGGARTSASIGDEGSMPVTVLAGPTNREIVKAGSPVPQVADYTRRRTLRVTARRRRHPHRPTGHW